MNKLSLLCYSQDEKDLTLLSKSLNKHIKNIGNLIVTGNKDSFLYSVEITSNNEPDIIVMNLSNDSFDTIELVNSVGKVTPNTIKIIIAESENLLSIQNHIHDK